jgi:hypothetical protein
MEIFMRNMFLAFIATLALTLTTANAADFQKGLAAAQSGDYATALKEWEPLAEQGDASVQYNLGVMYEGGLGIPQDYANAVKWYTLAAEQGPKSNSTRTCQAIHAPNEGKFHENNNDSGFGGTPFS